MSTSNLDVQGYFAHFLSSYEGDVAGLWYSDVMKVYESDSITDNFPGIEDMFGLQSFSNSGRTEKDITTRKVTINKSPFEDNVTMNRIEWQADKLGIFTGKVADMAIGARYDWNDKVVSLISTNGNGADGVAFFGTTHALADTSTQKNHLTATEVPALNVADTGLTPTDVEASNIIAGVLGKMLAIKAYNGKAANGGMRKVTILVGDALKYAAFAGAISKLILSGTVSNPVTGFQSQGFQFTVELSLGVAAINSGANVYFLRGDSPVTPFIGTENPVNISPSFEGIGSYLQTNYDKVRFGIQSDRGSGYGRYQSAFECVLS